MSEREITSLTNDTVKAVRALHMRKERETTGLFLAEGLKFIGEALDQGRTPKPCWSGWRRGRIRCWTGRRPRR
jgi:TrmH family RNA methyltransferase